MQDPPAGSRPRPTGPSPRPTVVLAHPSVDLYGSDRMLLESARGLAQDHDVVVCLPHEGPLAAECRTQGLTVVIRSMPVVRKAILSPIGFVRFLVSIITTLPGMVATLRRYKASSLYLNTETIPTWLVAARLARVPCVCHVHEAEEEAARALRFLLALPLLLAHGVIVNSDASRRVLMSSIARLDRRTVVVYNGLAGPDQEVPPLRDDLDPPIRLLLVGRLSPRKGSDIAVDALAILREQGVPARLGLAGTAFEGYEWYVQQLEEQVARLGLTEHVDFLGFTSPVWAIHAQADIVLMPSRAEPFGNAAVEAMLAGRPVVANAVQGLTEIITSGKTGRLVPTDNPRALAQAITELVDDWEETCRMASRGHDEATTRFSLDAYDDQVRMAMQKVERR